MQDTLISCSAPLFKDLGLSFAAIDKNEFTYSQASPQRSPCEGTLEVG
jgi:hypothetical protein